MKPFFKRFLTILIVAMLFALGTSWADNTTGVPQPVRPAYATGEEPFQLEMGFGFETLSTGNTWQEYYVSGEKVLGKNTGIYGTVRDTNRFNLSDQELLLGGYTPLGPQTTLGLFSSLSTGHVLANYALGGTINQSLGGGNGIEVGYQYRKYTPTGVNMESLTFEHYFTNNTRLAYTATFSQVTQPVTNGTGSAIGHTLTFSDYYTDRDSFNAALSLGNEADSIGPNTVELFNVRGISIYGKHWFNADNGLTYGYEIIDERGINNVNGVNNSFTRNGPRLGFIHTFETAAAATTAPQPAPENIGPLGDNSVVKFRIFDWMANQTVTTSIPSVPGTTGTTNLGSWPGYGMELDLRGKGGGMDHLGFGYEYENRSSSSNGTVARSVFKPKFFLTPRSSCVAAAIYADYMASTGGISGIGGGIELGWNITPSFSLLGHSDYSHEYNNAQSAYLWRYEVVADYHPYQSFMDYFIGYRANQSTTTVLDNFIDETGNSGGLIVGVGAHF